MFKLFSYLHRILYNVIMKIPIWYSVLLEDIHWNFLSDLLHLGDIVDMQTVGIKEERYFYRSIWMKCWLQPRWGTSLSSTLHKKFSFSCPLYTQVRSLNLNVETHLLIQTFCHKLSYFQPTMLTAYHCLYDTTEQANKSVVHLIPQMHSSLLKCLLYHVQL